MIPLRSNVSLFQLVIALPWSSAKYYSGKLVERVSSFRCPHVETPYKVNISAAEEKRGNTCEQATNALEC